MTSTPEAFALNVNGPDAVLPSVYVMLYAVLPDRPPIVILPLLPPQVVGLDELMKLIAGLGFTVTVIESRSLSHPLTVCDT
jgi:hypothetical protein